MVGHLIIWVKEEEGNTGQEYMDLNKPFLPPPSPISMDSLLSFIKLEEFLFWTCQLCSFSKL